MPRSAITRLIIIFAGQSLVWLAAAWGFLAFMVDRAGHYVTVPGAILYVVVSFAALLLVAFLATDTKRHPKLVTRLGIASLSPGIILFELLAISGNITPWVLAEPLMWLNIGNISVVAAREAAPQAPALAITKVSVEENPDRQSEERTAQFKTIQLSTAAGTIELRTNGVNNGTMAVVAIGGVGGGFDSPANDLYSRLGKELAQQGILVADVKLRKPTDFAACLTDVKTAASYLESCGIKRIILMGHSFGGGAVLQVAKDLQHLVGVIALSPQTTGSEAVSELSPKFVGLIHGVFDYVNPRFCSQDIYRRAAQPKAVKFVLAGHTLDEAADEVTRTSLAWIRNTAGPDVHVP